MSYCTYVRNSLLDTHNREYHDTEYGFPIRSDSALFERLVLEINQAGLSWLTILKKRTAFRAAYANFDVKKVAAFGEKDRKRLLQDAGIIRNKRKIEAAISNAIVVLGLIEEYGSFANWLDATHPADLESWKKLFKKTFFFTGGEIVREFLLSTGYLPNAHDEDCPVYAKILKLKPAWLTAKVGIDGRKNRHTGRVGGFTAD
jgi:DNA-3-methyladenine glycosylase I